MPSSISDVQSIDGGSDVLSESDFAAEPELASTRSHHHRNRLLRHLPGGETAPLSDIASDVDADVEAGSVRGGGGGGGDGDGGDQSDLNQAVMALSLVSDDEMSRRHFRGTTGYRTRASLWDVNHRARSGSSPSRSPARRTSRRASGRVTVKKNLGYGDDGNRKESFYDFLFN